VTDPSFDLERVLASEGPLPRETALVALDQAALLVRQTEFRNAARLYQRIMGVDDVSDHRRRLRRVRRGALPMDEDQSALHAWEEATRLPDNPSTYLAWRNVAAGRVRNQDLRGAFDAYKQAERRAPEQDRAEIANRLGWLAKELGDTSASGKYFAKARGDEGLSFTVVIIVVTTVISLLGSLLGPMGDDIVNALALDKVAWRTARSGAVDGDPGPRGDLPEPAPPAVQHVRPVARRPLCRADVRALAVPRVLPAVRARRVARLVRVQRRPRRGRRIGRHLRPVRLLFAAQRIHRPIIDRQSRAFMGSWAGCW
jgi:hypothetical protein